MKKEINHRGTEDTEETPVRFLRISFFCFLCVLCASVVNSLGPVPVSGAELLQEPALFGGERIHAGEGDLFEEQFLAFVVAGALFEFAEQFPGLARLPPAGDGAGLPRLRPRLV